ncbi:MAG: right-handed parallel beta-helix repeat-containing protein, partial [candidate division KSB1 bacterium]|nr:right-handed parallel beta-helix repeat-containing protein [candidate division KSB1 bacterium]
HESGKYKFRQPTKPEILCEINLALAYSAKGIVYYLYSTTSDSQNGLLDTNRNTTMRYDTVKAINNNYQNTGQTLSQIGANFMNLTWRAGYSIHQNLNEPIDGTYDLYDVTSKPSGGANDPENETYVEVGILQNASNVNHYMVVNRRCASNETREITLTFECQANRIYRVTNVYNGGITNYYLTGRTTFPFALTLGPGEGRLLRVEDLGPWNGNWSGNVTANTYWGGTVNISANVTVNSGVFLTILSGTTVTMSSGTLFTVNGTMTIRHSNTLRFGPGITLDVYGALTVSGTSSSGVTFERSGASGTWYGLWYRGNSSGSVSYATIRNAQKALRINANIAVTNCTISEFTEQGVYITSGGSPTVENCTITNTLGGSHGIQITGNNNNPSILNNTISEGPIGVARAMSPGPATISGNTITSCTTAGIQANATTATTIDSNAIGGCTKGILLINAATPNIHDNDIYENDYGVVLEQGQPSLLKWNLFGKNGGQFAPNWEACVLAQYLTAGNGFANNQSNNFYSDLAYGIYNTTATTFNARGNYWQAVVHYGPVDVSEPLPNPNPDAGRGGQTGKAAAPEEILATTPPENFLLAQSYPNPFSVNNAAAHIRFDLSERAAVEVFIYDLQGKLVRTLTSGTNFENGKIELVWDGKNENGQPVSSGIYFYRLQAQCLASGKQFVDSRKLTVVR